MGEPNYVLTARRLGLSGDQYIEFNEDDEKVALDGQFTVDDLRKIVDEMEKHSG